MRVAFHAPMKPPDHPRPSGDGLMARQIRQALDVAGHDVRLASRLRTWTRDPDPAWLARIAAEGRAECARLLAAWGGSDGGWRPDIWLTYHLYYRAPDPLGPLAAAALGIPHVVIEASAAPKRETGAWADFARHAHDALRSATLLLAMTDRDLAGLRAMEGVRGACALFPPFIADAGGRPPARPARLPVVLVTVAMMRRGAKHQNFRLLAAVMRLLPVSDWRLVVVGDGADSAAVRAMLAASCGARVQFTGLLTPSAVRTVLDAADVFVWPGHREPYGMVYLEAAASGLPTVAMRSGGVPDVVRDGTTALLSADLDVAAMAANLARLIGDATLRTRMGAAGRAFVSGERCLDRAAGRLDAHLRDALARGRPA